MQRYAEGDDSAFGAVYDELAPRLLAYLRRSVGNEALARDILQQAFLRLHRARGSFSPGSAVVPWAFAIARRAMLDALRTRRRRPEAALEAAHEPATIDDPERRASLMQEALHLQRRLRSLPESWRDAFELVRVEGLSLADAAAVLDTSASAVKMRAHRAYVALGLGGLEEDGS